jgi:hypothetical protein
MFSFVFDVDAFESKNGDWKVAIECVNWSI